MQPSLVVISFKVQWIWTVTGNFHSHLESLIVWESIFDGSFISVKISYHTWSICQGGYYGKKCLPTSASQVKQDGSWSDVLQRWLKCLVLELKDLGALFLLGSQSSNWGELVRPDSQDRLIVHRTAGVSLAQRRVQTRVISYTKKSQPSQLTGYPRQE